MIRVCHVITMLELGGAQQNTLYTVSHLDRTRFEPILVTGPGGLLDSEARGGDVPVHFVSPLGRPVAPAKDAAALVALTRLLRRLNPDIVHTHSSKAGILGRWAGLLAGVPHIVHSIHGFGFHDGQSRLTRDATVTLERVTGRLATSAFIAVSRANLRSGCALGLFTRDRVSLIHSGVRLSDFSPRERDAVPTNAPVVVGMIGCLKPQKAPLDFVAVAARVTAAAGRSRVRFVLVGDGVLRRDLEERIGAEGLEDVVTLQGWRRDVPEVLRGFDILLHTARWEGLPRVFPEAMATGLPIVATRVDGAPEAVRDGETGYLLEPGDIEGLARRTLELVTAPEMRRRMGGEARRHVGSWDIDDMVRRQESLYEGLIDGETAMGVARSTQLESMSEPA